MIIYIDASFDLVENDISVVNNILSSKMLSAIKYYMVSADANNNNVKIYLEAEVDENSEEITIGDIFNINVFLGDMINYIRIKSDKDKDCDLNNIPTKNQYGKPLSFIVAESLKAVDHINIIRYWDGEGNMLFKVADAKRFPDLGNAVRAFAKQQGVTYIIDEQINVDDDEVFMAKYDSPYQYFVLCYDFTNKKEKFITAYSLKERGIK